MEEEPARSLDVRRSAGRERVDACEGDEPLRMRTGERGRALVGDVIPVPARTRRSDDRAVDTRLVERTE
jgi:hypothetical protein